MGIKEDIGELKDLMKEKELKERERKYKLPFGKKVGNKQKRSNYVTVMIINENGQIEFKKYQIEE